VLDTIVGYDPADPQTAASVGNIPKSYTASLQLTGLRGSRIGLVTDLLGSDRIGGHRSAVFRRREIKATDLGNKTYMLEGQGGDITVAVGTDGIIMVDTQFAPLHDKIRDAIAKISPLPIKYVVITHYHGDHVGGNAAFDGDTWVMFPDANVLATGDVYGSRTYPNLDWGSGRRWRCQHWPAHRARPHPRDVGAGGLNPMPSIQESRLLVACCVGTILSKVRVVATCQRGVVTCQRYHGKTAGECEDEDRCDYDGLHGWSRLVLGRNGFGTPSP
jgi:Metallo-beta-lactamase superfamily